MDFFVDEDFGFGGCFGTFFLVGGNDFLEIVNIEDAIGLEFVDAV